MTEWIRGAANMKLRGRDQSSQRKIFPSGAMPKPNSTWTEVEKSPFRVEWLVNNSLKQDKA
jgi:hypothetical protein